VKRFSNLAGTICLVAREAEGFDGLRDVDARDEKPTIGDGEVHGDFIGWV